MPHDTLTIGRLAKAARVGIETIRYYQQRELLPVPPATSGYRQYPKALVHRIRFIKRAQELGFTLEEVAGLLQLSDGTHRAAVRAIASARLAEIEAKLTDLARMQHVLAGLVNACAHTRGARCPIIDSLSQAA